MLIEYNTINLKRQRNEGKKTASGCSREPVFGANRCIGSVDDSFRSFIIAICKIAVMTLTTLQSSTKVLAEDKRNACQIRVVPRWKFPFVPAVMQLARGFLYLWKGEIL